MKLRILRNCVLASSLIFIACGAIPYNYYAPYPESFKGVMVGPKEQRDFEECDPHGGDNRCVVLFAEEFSKILRDKADVEQRLKDCEKSHKAP